VTGYPRDTLNTQANADFVAAYGGKFNALPMMGSVVGYAMIRAIAAGIVKTGSVDTEKMADGFKGAAFDTPFGAANFRAIDHQSTLGTFVGRTGVKAGSHGTHGEMVDWRYADGANYLPDDAMVRKLRSAAD
jgi:branched-chain amino acid transport system substrate-binding protein